MDKGPILRRVLPRHGHPIANDRAGAGQAPASRTTARGTRNLCTGFSHAGRYFGRALLPEVAAVDAVYLLILAALYFVTHGLVWALDRLGEPS
jgi:hypothetical protein